MRFAKNFSKDNLCTFWVSCKWRNAWSTFRGKLARKREPAPKPENIHDCLQWNGSHAQASLEFRPSLVTRRHRRTVHRRRERRARFSSPIYSDNGRPEVSNLSISASNRPGQLGFVPSRVSRVAHYQRRTKGDPTFTLRRVLYSPRGHLKIRVLYSSPLCETDVVYVCMYVRKLP